jgi:catechol 2,3-dioxygenase-like lactoylglutathione lyase family enzyme
MRGRPRRLLGTGFLALVLAAFAAPARAQSGVRDAGTLAGLGVLANNAFFYYTDLDRAHRFYTETLGFRVVADYGFAKILQIAPTSFLTLVLASRGMHSADEPKTVALAIVTDELEAWHAHVTARQVPLRGGPFQVAAGRPHDGFVAIDPEGYFLEFERFHPHAENQRLIPLLARTPRLGVSPAAGPTAQPGGVLTVHATILWLYYKDLAAAQRFYESRLGFLLTVDQGWAKIYQTSRTGYIGLVDGARGMHRPTEKKAVNVSFLCANLDLWFAAVQTGQLLRLRGDAINTNADKRHRAFVGFDPEDYFLEFDHFLPHPLNSALMQALSP